MHLPCAGVPSPAPFPACLAAPRTLTVVVEVAAPEVPAVVALVGVVALALTAAWLAVEDTWVAASTLGAGTFTVLTHMGTPWSSTAFLDPSLSAGTRTAAHTHTAPRTNTRTAAATPPSLSAEQVERAKQLKHGSANRQAVTESNVQTA